MKIKKSLWITIIIIIGVVAFALIMRSSFHNETPEEVAKCIGENSIVYVQLGCHACASQEKLFGENYQQLNIVDCFYEREKCVDKEITATPTWIINGEKHIGVQSIEDLKKFTGC